MSEIVTFNQNFHLFTFSAAINETALKLTTSKYIEYEQQFSEAIFLSFRQNLKRVALAFPCKKDFDKL